MMNVHKGGRKPVIMIETTKFFAKLLVEDDIQKGLRRNTFKGGEVQKTLLYSSMEHHEDIIPLTYQEIQLKEWR